MIDNIDKNTPKIWTAAQSEAVFSPSPRLLVAASAGSGKTSVMTERAAELVRGGVSLKNILIVTFTAAAAAEMKTRLAARLEGSVPGFRREDLYAADIGTLHSFCKKLITQFFYKLGIDPGFIVAEAGELAALKEAAADAAAEQGFQSGDEVFAELADFMAAGKRRDFALKNTVKRIYEYSHNSADPGAWLDNAHVFCENSPAACDKAFAPYVKKLAETVKSFSSAYDGLKSRDAKADFIDLERLALKLLDDDEALEFVRAKYKYVFVDEYQDINPKQEAIITKLAGDNRLFMVGDLKQSIYGFRSCEPRIFMEKMRDPGHTLITIGDNFRSRPEILRFCDDVFGKLMTAESCGIDYAGRNRFGPGLPFPGASAFPAVSCGFIRDGKPEDEARIIADAIARILGEKIYVPKEKTCRAAGYGDIAVLMSVVRGAYPRAVYRALVRMGVPVRSEANLSAKALPEVRLLIDFMRVIDNPMQDIPLAAVMRSCFFRFTDNELASLRKEFPTEPYFHLCVLKAADSGEGGALYKKARAFTAELERLKGVSGGLTSARLLEKICRDFDYEGSLLSGEGGSDAANAVESFIAAVRENRFCATLGGFVSVADSFEDAESAEPVPPGANCVRLSSIHHAKGMEFPVVILAATGLKFTDKNVRLPVICHKDLGIAIKPKGGREEGDNGSSAFYAAADKLFEEECREKQRLLYVALTRAQNHLIITGSYKTKKNEEREGTGELCRAAGKSDTREEEHGGQSFSDWLRLYRSEFCEYTEHEPEENGACAVKNEAGLFGEPDEEYIEAYLKAPEEVYPYAAAAAAPAKTTATKLSASDFADAYGDTGDGYGYGRRPEKGAPESREAGTAFHTLLKHINISAVTQNEIMAEAERLVREGLLTASAAKLIDIGKAGVCMNSPLFERARRAAKVWREQDFLYLTEEEGAEALVQGAIDLMFAEEDGLVIADYKLSGLPAEAVAERYKKQLGIYSAAAGEILGLPVKEKLIFLLNSGGCVKV